METALVIILLIMALIIIVNRVRKQFSSEGGQCSGDCGCCQSNPSAHHKIIYKEEQEISCDEKP